MEPRLKWNKIILAAKIILFHFRRGSVLKWNNKILKIILDVVPYWNKIISDPSSRRRSVDRPKIMLKNFILTRNHVWNKIK